MPTTFLMSVLSTIRQESRTALPSQTTRANSQKKRSNALAWYKMPRSTRPAAARISAKNGLDSYAYNLINDKSRQEQAQDYRQRGDFLVGRFARGEGGIRRIWHDETKQNATVGEGCLSKIPENLCNERISYKGLFIYSFRCIF